MYKKILVPLDGSERAEAILPHVEAVAACFDAQIIVLVVDDSDIQVEIDEIINTEIYLQERARMRNKLVTYAGTVIKRLNAKGITADFMLGKGPVVQSILKTAKRENVDLVAMASHGHGGWKRVFYGSVAAGVLQHIDRPILMIRSRYADTQASE